MSTMGRSFWILYDLTPLHEIDERVASADAHLFAVKDPYRLRMPRRGNRTVMSPDEPQYPEAGANIDYYLASEPTGEIELEILDEEGHVVRSFSSDASGETNVLPEEASMREWRLERVGTAKLDKSAGMHRFTWDLRHAGPWNDDASSSGRRGPLAAPGTYQARLKVGDWTETVSFEALMDPRIVKEGYVSPEDVTGQVSLALKARDALSRARLAASRLEKALESASDGQKAALEQIDEELNTVSRRYSQPMLVDQISYLYQNLDRADQRAGRDAVERYESLAAQLEEQIGKLDEILGATEEDR